MHRFNRLSTFEKTMSLLCICGILLSATTFLMYMNKNEEIEWVSIDDYIATIESSKDGIALDSIVNEQRQEEEEVVTDATDINTEQLKVNINTATYEQLLQLKGIGPTKAQAIIKERNLGGAFVSIEDIMRVKGIGYKTYESIKESLVY